MLCAPLRLSSWHISSAQYGEGFSGQKGRAEMSILFALGALNVAAAASGAPELYAVVAPQHDHISKCESARDPSG